MSLKKGQSRSFFGHHKGKGAFPLRSAWLVGLFRLYLRFLFWRRFSAIRVARVGLPEYSEGAPILLYCNHPSWWDPALMLLTLPKLLRHWEGFGPMDAAELGRYGVLRRMGIFGIEPRSRTGAAAFLRIGRALLRNARTLLCITAEGAFTDPRIRPVRLRPGIAHLARAHPHAIVLPLALEYIFWNESKPEALMRFGLPVALPFHASLAAWQTALEEALGAAMDALAVDSAARDPSPFLLVYGGTAGIGGLYDLQRRLRARIAGRAFSARHTLGND